MEGIPQEYLDRYSKVLHNRKTDHEDARPQLLILITILPMSRSLQVYDCDRHRAKFEMISLLGPRRCPDPKRDYHKPKMVQLLQQKVEARVTAHQCQAKRTKRVTQCGFNSLTNRQHITNWRRTMKVLKEECWRAVKDKVIVLLNRTLKIAPNGHMSTTIIMKGRLDQQFNCRYGHFVSGGKYFCWSFEQTTLEVDVHPIKARYDQRTDQIVLNSGMRGWFFPGVLHDNQLGTIVWR